MAVPFAPDDPIYGTEPGANEGWGIQLGALEPRGEKGLLSIPAGQFNRLRSNPFFPYIERRLISLVAGDRGIGDELSAVSHQPSAPQTDQALSQTNDGEPES